MAKNEVAFTSFRTSPEIHRALSLLAFLDRIPLAKLITAAAEEYLAKRAAQYKNWKKMLAAMEHAEGRQSFADLEQLIPAPVLVKGKTQVDHTQGARERVIKLLRPNYSAVAREAGVSRQYVHAVAKELNGAEE